MLESLRACNFIKNRLQHKCFPVKFVKFLRAAFLLNTSSGCFYQSSQQKLLENLDQLLGQTLFYISFERFIILDLLFRLWIINTNIFMLNFEGFTVKSF